MGDSHTEAGTVRVYPGIALRKKATLGTNGKKNYDDGRQSSCLTVFPGVDMVQYVVTVALSRREHGRGWRVHGRARWQHGAPWCDYSTPRCHCRHVPCRTVTLPHRRHDALCWKTTPGRRRHTMMPTRRRRQRLRH